VAHFVVSAGSALRRFVVEYSYRVDSPSASCCGISCSNLCSMSASPYRGILLFPLDLPGQCEIGKLLPHSTSYPICRSDIRPFIRRSVIGAVDELSLRSLATSLTRLTVSRCFCQYWKATRLVKSVHDCAAEHKSSGRLLYCRERDAWQLLNLTPCSLLLFHPPHFRTKYEAGQPFGTWQQISLQIPQHRTATHGM